MGELVPEPGHPVLSRQLPAVSLYSVECAKACWAPRHCILPEFREQGCSSLSGLPTPGQGEPRSVWFYVSLPVGRTQEISHSIPTV